MVKTGKAAVMSAPYKINTTEVEIKSPGRGEVELQVGYVGICGTDLHAYFGGETIFNFPVVFGHEFSAQVLSCGIGVDHLQEGQWVAVAPLLSCGNCSFCNTGNKHLCEQRIIFGAVADGALRERLIMPAEVVIQLPEGVSPAQGALGEPLAVAVHAVNQSKLNLEEKNIIISGAGAIGLLIAMVVEQRGANRILLLDIDERRRSFAQELGFHAVLPKEAPSSTADCVFIATSAAGAITAIPELITSLGIGVVVGIITEAQLNWFQLLLKEGSVTTSRYFTLNDFQEAIRLLGIPGFKAKSIIQEQVSFKELFVDDGKRVMNRAQQVLRLLIKI